MGPYFWGVQLHTVSGSYHQTCIGFDVPASEKTAIEVAHAEEASTGRRLKALDDPSAKHKAWKTEGFRAKS